MGNGKPMKLWKVGLFIVAFLIVLSVFRTGWVMYFDVSSHEQAVNGEIDLSEYDFSSNKPVNLDGEWEFYPDTFLFFDEEKNRQKQYDTVPHNWREIASDLKLVDTFGYGTYRLKIQLPETEREIYGIRASVASAAKMYVNGKLVTSFGQLATTEEEYDGNLGPFSTYFQVEEDEIELVIHAANFGHPLDGGIVYSVLIGSEQAIS